ncbi:MAG: PEFG-CTERM domain-containing protein [Nitrosopumilus sp.]|nr:PEFG-CTERM domain-containing protein [Nitrosopumilus sp.]
MIDKRFLFVPIFFLMLLPTSKADAEHVLDVEAFAQYLDISQLESDKFVLEIDGNSYDLYYGYHGSLDAMGSDFQDPTLSEIIVNNERKSLEITMIEVPERTDFWVRVPFEVISAEKENYQILVDGVDTGYDLMKFPNDYVFGVFIHENTEHIEIVGTTVIPEFGTLSILIFFFALFGTIYLVKKSAFYTNLTTIN